MIAPDPLAGPQLLLTADQAAATLCVCRKTLYGLTFPRGTLKAVMIGRSVRYSVTSLREWIAQQEQ